MKHTNKSHLVEFIGPDRTLFIMDQEWEAFLTHRKQTDNISFTHGKQRETKKWDGAIKLEKPAPHDIVHPESLKLLKLPQLFWAVPSAGNRCSYTGA